MREIVKLRGQKSIATLSGDISLNQNDGNLVVKRNGKVLTLVDDRGFSYFQQDGKRRILIGAAPNDGRIGFWATKNNIDVFEQLGG